MNFYSWVFDGSLKKKGGFPNGFLSLFDRSDFDQYGRGNGDSPWHIEMMSPDRYLELCEPIPADDMKRHEDLEKKILSGEIKKFDHLPMLKIRQMEDSSDAKVFGHDGRHRMMVMKKLGYKGVPVVMFAENFYWGVMDKDRDAKWPKYIWRQNDKSKELDKYRFKFPVAFENRVGKFSLPELEEDERKSNGESRED